MLFDLQGPRLACEFGGFIHGPRLAGAVLAARKAACGETSAYLWGPAGSGKSHLVRAAENEARRNGVGLLEPGGEIGGGPSLAAVDDVGDLEPDAMQWLLETLRRSLQGDAQVSLLVTGPEAPATLGVRTDVRTRLQELPCFQLAPLDDGELCEAICSHAARLGRLMPEAVAKVLVERLPRDMASLSAAMDELDAHAIASDARLTAAVARDWLDSREGAS